METVKKDEWTPRHKDLNKVILRVPDKDTPFINYNFYAQIDDNAKYWVTPTMGVYYDSGKTALVVKSLDRLSRNKRDIKTELEWFKNNNIRLKVIDLPTTMMDLPEGQEWVFEMVNNILIEVLGTIAEQERATIKSRQAEGINTAKAKGVKFGRPALQFPANWDEVYTQWKNGEITAKVAMEKTGTKRTSFYKLVNKYVDS